MPLFFTLILAAYICATVGYIVHFVNRDKKFRTIARGIIITTGIVHTIYLVGRYFQAGHTPLTSHHEAISFFAWSLTWAFISFRWRYRIKNFGAFVSPIVTALMFIAVFSSHEIFELPPALQSLWLPVHASIALAANGFLALAFSGGIMYLIQERELKKKRFGFFYTRLPSLEALDTLNHHSLTIGFSLLTLGIITGSFWAKQAWGTYWHWDPKETWSLITWFFYAALIHQRFAVGWRGRRAAIMSIIGFSAVLFTMWGVTFLLGGIHSYVG
ncbi:MAG: c-type cytochrome biogenesis protein CcsB [Proteobacteria bacterium]|nr:c-type cytochrome biogenesis protein CcsB [Pseudomonadota bacterium]